MKEASPDWQEAASCILIGRRPCVGLWEGTSRKAARWDRSGHTHGCRSWLLNARSKGSVGGCQRGGQKAGPLENFAMLQAQQ